MEGGVGGVVGVGMEVDVDVYVCGDGRGGRWMDRSGEERRGGWMLKFHLEWWE